MERPDPPAELLGLIGRIVSRTSVRLVNSGPSRSTLMAELFRKTGGSFRLVTDVHLDAPAIELNAVLVGNDTDFTRSPPRRRPELWQNYGITIKILALYKIFCRDKIEYNTMKFLIITIALAILAANILVFHLG